VARPAFCQLPHQAAALFLDNQAVSGGSLIDLVCSQTNIYLSKLKADASCPLHAKHASSFTKQETYGFLAIVLSMGLVSLPAEVDYWSSEPLLAQPFIASIMARDRFALFKRCLSVGNADAATRAADKLAMVRKALTLFHTVSHRYYRLKCDLGLDETQCQSGHRYSPIAHRGDNKANKPLNEYIKTFGLHESGSGYAWAFEVDLRDGTTVKDIVYRLVDTLPEQGHRIATDRYYTSVSTAVGVLRRGHHMYGTLRTDRGLAPDVAASTNPKHANNAPLADCEFRWRMALIHGEGHNEGDDDEEEGPPIGAIISGVWRDTSATGVPYLSTCHGPESGLVTRRKKRSSGAPGVGKEPKVAPMVTVDYNLNMGAVDQSNSLKAVYNCQLKHQRRWYLPLFYYVLELLILNSRIVYQDKVGAITHKTFRLEVITWLRNMAESGHLPASSPPTKRRRYDTADRLPLDRRLGVVGQHEIVKVDTKERRSCKLCSASKKGHKNSSYKCKKCGVFLHVPDCWNVFHRA
jgi:hypothetical protein